MESSEEFLLKDPQLTDFVGFNPEIKLLDFVFLKSQPSFGWDYPIMDYDSPEDGSYNHAGIVVDESIIPMVGMNPSTKYLLESTGDRNVDYLSRAGSLGGCYNKFHGLHLRELEPLLRYTPLYRDRRINYTSLNLFYYDEDALYRMALSIENVVRSMYRRKSKMLSDEIHFDYIETEDMKFDMYNISKILVGAGIMKYNTALHSVNPNDLFRDKIVRPLLV